MNNDPEARVGVPQLDLRLPELLDSLPDGAYITDTKRTIVFWNKAAERITGWRARDVVGRNCSDNILAHIDKDGHALCGGEQCPLHRSIVTGQASTEAMVVFARRKYGIAAPVEVSVAPLRDRAGQIIGGIEIFRDVTESMQDLLRAKGIQEQTVACCLPEDARLQFEIRYQPHETVGGDFYRLECRNGDHYTILVADAMGHGVAAALHSMQLRVLWDDHRAELNSPGRFSFVKPDSLNRSARPSSPLGCCRPLRTLKLQCKWTRAMRCCCLPTARSSCLIRSSRSLASKVSSS